MSDWADEWARLGPIPENTTVAGLAHFEEELASELRRAERRGIEMAAEVAREVTCDKRIRADIEGLEIVRRIRKLLDEGR